MTHDGGGIRHQQRYSADHQNPDRHHQHAGDYPFHLGDPEALAEIGRGASNHQAAQEHGQQHEQHHAVDTGTHTAEDDLTEQHVDHADHATQRVKLSCMALTEPLEADVVATSQMLESTGPKRLSLPSQLPAWVVSWASAGSGCSS